MSGDNEGERIDMTHFNFVLSHWMREAGIEDTEELVKRILAVPMRVGDEPFAEARLRAIFSGWCEENLMPEPRFWRALGDVLGLPRDDVLMMYLVYGGESSPSPDEFFRRVEREKASTGKLLPGESGTHRIKKSDGSTEEAS